MSEFHQDVIWQWREMARRRDSVGTMFGVLKKRLRPDATIVTMIESMRSAVLPAPDVHGIRTESPAETLAEAK